MKLFYKLLFTFILLNACSESQNIAPSPSDIDINEINTFDVELSLEIIEGEKFQLGNPFELRVLDNGEIIVFDQATVTIHHFNKDGTYKNTIAREGRGPAEVENSATYRAINNDTLIVRPQIFKPRRDIYVRDKNTSNFVYSRSFEFTKNGRISSLLALHPVSGYFHSFNSMEELMMNDQKGIYRLSYVAHLNAKGSIATDSLFQIKSANMLRIPDKNSSFGYEIIGIVPYPYADRLVPFTNSNQYMIARADSLALYVYNADHQLNYTIPLSFARRPITEEDLVHQWKGNGATDKGKQAKMKPYIADYKPPFLNVILSENHIWLHTDNTALGKEYVILDFEGNVVGKTYLEKHDFVWRVIGNKVYCMNRKPDELHSIRVYSVSMK